MEVLVANPSHVEEKNSLLECFSSNDFIQNHLINDTPPTMRFHVDTIHCGNCAWKIERGLKPLNYILDILPNVANSSVEVSVTETKYFTDFIHSMSQLGFSVTPLKNIHRETSTLDSDLMRLAVAAFSAGNIMTLAVANYFGAAEKFRFIFDVLSFFLLLPSLLYSAWSFHHGLILFFKNRIASLDFPISTALILGTSLSVINLIRGSGPVYFDSLAALIFLILLSRFILARLKEKLFQEQVLEIIPGAQLARKKINGVFTVTTPDKLSPGDVILVRKNEVFPADGVLINKLALVNTSVLTGEPYPQSLDKGAEVFAGCRLCSEDTEVLVKTVDRNTRVAKILLNTEIPQAKIFPQALRIEVWAQRFTYVVLGLSAIIFLSWLPISVNEGLNRVLALLMVACPCSLTFGFPLIMSICLKQAQKIGFIIQKPEALNELLKIKNIFIDKTGTLTSENLTLLSNPEEDFSAQDLSAILSLELKSQHPIAKTLLNRFPDIKTVSAEEFKYLPTEGISGYINGCFYQLRAQNKNQESLVVEVYKNHSLIGKIEFVETIRPRTTETIQQLIKEDYIVHILSGDPSQKPQSLAQELSINGKAWCGLTPEDKKDIITNYKHSLMIGDGINDAAAISTADVSIALPGPLEQVSKVADILTTHFDLSQITQLFSLARFLDRTLLRLSLFSFVYNITTAMLAIMGYIHPLIAAILMPLSSVTVVFLVFLSYRELKWKSFL